MKMHGLLHRIRQGIDDIEDSPFATTVRKLEVVDRFLSIERIHQHLGVPLPRALCIPALVDCNATQPELQMVVVFKNDIGSPQLDENLLVHIFGGLAGPHLAIGYPVDIGAEEGNRTGQFA